jgi:hypothetical protein
MNTETETLTDLDLTDTDTDTVVPVYGSLPGARRPVRYATAAEKDAWFGECTRARSNLR